MLLEACGKVDVAVVDVEEEGCCCVGAGLFDCIGGVDSVAALAHIVLVLRGIGVGGGVGVLAVVAARSVAGGSGALRICSSFLSVVAEMLAARGFVFRKRIASPLEP